MLLSKLCLYVAVASLHCTSVAFETNTIKSYTTGGGSCSGLTLKEMWVMPAGTCSNKWRCTCSSTNQISCSAYTSGNIQGSLTWNRWRLHGCEWRGVVSDKRDFY